MTRRYTLLTLLIGLLLGTSYDQRADAQFLGNIGTTTCTAAGTTCTVVGDNTKGVVTVGVAVVTSVALNFSHTLSVTPGCIVTPTTALSIPSTPTITTSVATIAFSVSISGAKFSYWCFDPTARF